MKGVYTTVKDTDGKLIRVRIGTAVKNDDGTLTVRLDALPVGGVLAVRK